MSYVNGKEILPSYMLAEIQKYYGGGLIYIPLPEDKKAKWGSNTTTKEYLTKRNNEIRLKKKRGASIQELMKEYHLSYDTIKKIIYSH